MKWELCGMKADDTDIQVLLNIFIIKFDTWEFYCDSY